MKNFASGVAAFLICGAVGAMDLVPARHVQGHVLGSDQDPAIRIEVPKEAVYVGAARWALYDVADCEVHVFVEADAQKKVQRFYWIQFEGYLPTRPELRHNYSDKTMSFGGQDYFVRARFGPTSDTGRAGSDLEHVMGLIAGKGYTLPPEMANVRLVHLLDDGGRKELMIIYDEDLALSGLTSTDLITGGKINEKWAPVEKGLIARAQARIVLHPVP